MKVLVLGGTGVISRHIVEQLLDKNHDVTVFNRGNSSQTFRGKVEQMVGDRRNWEQFEAMMQKRRFDAVIDMICFNEEDAKSNVRAFRESAGHIVVTSSVAAYKRPYRTAPVVEEAEELWDDPTFGYAYHKAEMERYLAKVVKAEKLPITIIRPSLTYGPGAANIGVLRQNYGIIDRIKKGKPLVMFGDGTTPWSWTFAPDLAKAYVNILGKTKTFGQAYQACSEERHIWDDLYLEFGRIVGIQPRIVHIPSELLYKAAPNLCNHLYFEKTYSGLFDNAKIRRDVPEFQVTISLREGLQVIAGWWEKEACTVDQEKDALEDKLVSIHSAWSDQIANLFVK